MGPGYFIIAILGCGESDAACQPVRTLEVRYESQAACARATEVVLPAQNDDYPVVVAQCVAAGAAPKPLKAHEVKLPEGGTMEVPNSPVRSRS
jgi:hypothetical protein